MWPLHGARSSAHVHDPRATEQCITPNSSQLWSIKTPVSTRCPDNRHITPRRLHNMSFRPTHMDSVWIINGPKVSSNSPPHDPVNLPHIQDLLLCPVRAYRRMLHVTPVRTYTCIHCMCPQYVHIDACFMWTYHIYRIYCSVQYVHIDACFMWPQYVHIQAFTACVPSTCI